YPGIFLISLLTNASLFLPLPGVLITSAMGAVFNPLGVALAAGSGAALGELSGYLAGFSGQAVIENQAWYDRLVYWMKKYGDIIVLLLAFFPNPLFDMTGLVAGSLKMPLIRFIIWTWVGKFFKMLVFALGGAAILDLLPF
ncbi:MAG TPA: VTT domain-containing protein, partial [Anaerolineaceae bacterium]|nr:VTT domain-containing protein [Anaerolineaceae bacterium]